ncbi:hypothetical protein OIV83_005836 [Microbotryomycetes sp. JL201]|nr:hypothetical protein OIV83_005836 [Microbotryomycetes sp. JL201]
MAPESSSGGPPRTATPDETNKLPTPRRPPPQARQSTLTRRVSFPDAHIDDVTLARLQRWMWCFAVVEFDLDTGVRARRDLYNANEANYAFNEQPILDNVYPNVNLNPLLKANIAFSSLPEGELPSSKVLTYSWRIPADGLRSSTSDTCTQADSLPRGGDGFLHGFVYFAQEKDEQLRRGFSQRSLVLVSHLPSLPGLFESALAIIGPLYFKHKGGGMVEAACHNIASWPDPASGLSLELPLLGSVLSISMPLGNRAQWPPPPAKLTKKIGSPLLNPAISFIPASIPLTPLSTALHGTLSFSRILLLWELVLLGEPILISAPDPRTGADLVHHLRNLIRPVSLAGDYRPFFHIHDTDYSRIANNSKPAAGNIVATTNPLVVSSCKHWPNIIRTRVVKTDDPTIVAGLTSPRKRHVRKEPSVAKAVDKAFASGDYLGCDAVIFQHLAHLTELFLAPLNRYFGTLSKGDNSLVAPSHSRSFTPDDFIASLASHGTPLPFRQTATSLATPISVTSRFYLKFLKCPNFASWLHERHDLESVEIRKRYLERLEQTDLESWFWTTGRRTNEIEELVGRLEKEATLSEAAEAERSGSRQRSVNLRSQAQRLKNLRDQHSRESSPNGISLSRLRVDTSVDGRGGGGGGYSPAASSSFTSGVDSDDFDAASD